MKNKIIAANWKMNKDRDEAIDFIFKVNEKAKSVKIKHSYSLPQYS